AWERSSANPNLTVTTADQKSDTDDARPYTESGQTGSKYHWQLGTVGLSAGYFSGPLFYPYAPFGLYPYYYTGVLDFYGSFAYLPNLSYGTDKGRIKLAAEPKQAEVYIDGAYAGTADRLKTIWLEPGAYDLSVSYAGHESFHQRIYV